MGKMEGFIGIDPNRIVTLEDKYVRTTRFELVSSGTSGTVTLPENSTIVLDDFGGATDAVVSKVSASRPTFEQAITSGGDVVATTFDANGAYTLTDAPSAYPVAIIYRVQQKLSQLTADASNSIGPPHIGAGGNAPNTASFVTISAEPLLSNERRLAGTANQITVTDNGAGQTVALSTPQDIHSGASPTFTNEILTGYQEFTDMAAPSAGASSKTRLYGFSMGSKSHLGMVAPGGLVQFVNRECYVMVAQSTGSTITKGTPVYFNGAVTTVSGAVLMRVSLARANAQSTIAAGIAAEDIANNGSGRILIRGRIENIDTSAFSVGAILYLSESVAGTFTATAPSAPNFSQRMARVAVSSATTGVIEVGVLEIDGNETGTSARTFSIGDGTVNTMSYQFRAGVTGSLSWNPTTATRTMRLQDGSGTVVYDIADTTGLKTIQFNSSGNSSSQKLTVTTAQTTSQSLAVPNVSSGDSIVTNSTTATLTEKKIQRRSVALTSGTSVSWNSDNADRTTLVLGHNATISADSGVGQYDGQPLVMRFRQNATGGGSANTLAFATGSSKSFEWTTDVPSASATMPTAANAWMELGWAWNSTASRWRAAYINKG